MKNLFTPRFKNQKGFTLLEVSISIIILALAGVTLKTAQTGNITRVRKSKLVNNVSFLLEEKMSEVLLKYEGKPLSEVPEEETGDFGKDYPTYKWKIESQPFVMPSLRANYMAENEEGTTNELVITVLEQMKEYFNKSIKELRVTIYVDLPQKKQAKYSAVTYLVDYDQELTVPGIGEAGGSEEAQ